MFYVKMRELYKTDIERIMYDSLKENEIVAVSEYPVRCKYGYILDFAIPDLKIAIECDGERWHKVGNRRDQKRDGFLRKFGWIILRFRGKEIKDNINQCIERVKKTIERRKENDNKV